LTDYYKILNLTFEASETEIKKRFRKLATIHHPDKNGGSKNAEETFKIILNAYETLSNKDKRAIYDLKYYQQFRQPNPETKNQNNTKQENQKQPPQRNEKHQRKEQTNTKGQYRFWFIILLLGLFYLYSTNKTTTTTTTTGNPKADKKLEEETNENRPQSGELNFNK
jgi:curved DNA-binding protein CbpA